MITKTEFAFRASAEKLFDDYPEVYFWSFTMKKVMSDWCYSGVWKRFMHDVGQIYGGCLRGLRVVELHKSHGLHWHCLLNKRVWIGEVLRIGKRYGVGRMHVKRCNRGVIDYLIKYVSKDFGGPKINAGIRRWGTIGGFVGVRVASVEVESPFHKRLDLYRFYTGEKKVPFLVSRRLCEMRGASDLEVKRLALSFESFGSISPDPLDVVLPMSSKGALNYVKPPGPRAWGGTPSRNVYDGFRAGRITAEALEVMHNDGEAAIQCFRHGVHLDEAARSGGGRWQGS